MKKIKVWLIDETYEQAQKWGEQLANCNAHFKTFQLEQKVILTADLKELAKQLSRRQLRHRGIKSSSDEDDLVKDDLVRELDAVDVFVVDYDLIGKDSGVSFTGEDLAYLVRCFSKCKVIIAVNQFFSTDAFELDLCGYPWSYADVNVAEPQIFNPGLWDFGARGEFRPWHWPSIVHLVKQFPARIKQTEEVLDEPILKCLSFPDEAVRSLSRSASTFLGSLKDVEEITFREFVTESGHALRKKDAVIKDNKMIARVAAARITRWLEDHVLSGQEILIDAPHLAQRAPQLLASTKPSAFKATLSLFGDEDPNKICSRLKLDASIAHCMLPAVWTTRPAWFWCTVSAHARSKPFSVSEYVFCEDSSSFEKKDTAQQFIAKVESPSVRRYAKRLDHIEYRSVVRFSL